MDAKGAMKTRLTAEAAESAEKDKTNFLPLIYGVYADKPKPLKHGGTEEAEENQNP
jgi:hypothetical protein